ncbi:uncharacterized protein LOC117324221 [Pecten maximus]|uniref:uncharacterized protein LOC117324221 n=1 Tax=Pecten maximus TaxID=6579 RepID=UPI0014581976|nr:uncharacterized protein LOC117324221 [Pecten maximus]
MDPYYYLVGLVLLAGHTSRGEYLGGSMRYSLYEDNAVMMVNVTILTGWKLGTGPCGNVCKIGQSTSSSLGEDTFGRWVTEEVGTDSLHNRDITHMVDNTLHQTVIDINTRENWELELGTFSLPLHGHSMNIIYFKNNMAMLTVQTGVTKSYMQMKINMPGNRSDTGIPNRSPITDSRPFMRLALGRHYHLRIPTVDPDQDFVSCRLPRYVEFLDLFRSPAPNVTVNGNCTIDVYTDPSVYSIGDTTLVGVVVEDFPRTQIHIRNTSSYLNGYSQSLSQTPVQFYFEVTDGDDGPVFIHPPTPPNGQVFTLYNGTKFTIEVFAKPSAENRTITNFRFVSDGMAKYLMRSQIHDRHDIGPLVRSQHVVWIPSTDMSGFYSLCIIAEDSEGFYSVPNYCFTIEVKDYPNAKGDLTLRPGTPQYVNFPQPDELNFPVNSVGLFPIYAGYTANDGSLLIRLTNKSSQGMMMTSIDNTSTLSTFTVQTHSSLNGKRDVCFQIGNDSSLLERCTNVHFLAADPCERMPCRNRGLCVRSNTGDAFTCHCVGGYTGVACEIAPDPCASQPCKNGGTCFLLYRFQYRCACPLGKTGWNCDNEINYCQSDSCDFGVCEDRPGNFTCHCAEGFTGTRCTGSDNTTALCPSIRQNITDCKKQCNWCSEPHGICRPGTKADQYDVCTCSLGYDHPGTHCQQVNGDFITARENGPKFVPPTPGPLSTISCELYERSLEKCSFPVYATRSTKSRTAPVVESLWSINELKVRVSSASLTGITDVFMYVITAQQSKKNHNSREKYNVCLKASSGGDTSDRMCTSVYFTYKGLPVNAYDQYRRFMEPTLPHDSTFTCKVGKACHMYLYTEKDLDNCERIVSGKDADVEIFSPELLNGSCVTDVAFRQVSVKHQRLCFRAGLGGESRCFGVMVDSSEDICTDDSCSNAGVCVPQASSYYCVCPPNFSGASCQSYEGPCLHNLCQNHGVCYENDSSIQCLCQIGYSGDKCQNSEILNIHDSVTKAAIFYPEALPTNVTCFVNSRCFINVFITSIGSSKFSVSPGYTDIIYEEMSTYHLQKTVPGHPDELYTGVLMLLATQKGHGRSCIQILDEISGSIDERCFTIDIQTGYTASVNKIFPYFEKPSSENNTIFECIRGSECHIMIWVHKADGEMECPKVEVNNGAVDTIGTIVIQNTTNACVMDVTLQTRNLNEETDLCVTLRPNGVEPEIYERGYYDKRCYSVLLRDVHSITTPCANFTCHNGGYCDSTKGVPDCLCRQGSSGEHCQLLHPGMHINTADRRVSFADDAFPSNIVCQLGEQCSFILNLWSPGKESPTVWFDHVDSSIIPEQPTRQSTTELSPGFYSLVIKVNGTQVGTFETILQTSDDTGIVSDELWYRYDIRKESTVTIDVNQPHLIKPSFPAESTIKCSNERLCHIILLSQSAAFEQCPRVEFVSEPQDSVHIFQYRNGTTYEHGSCMADVALLASNKQLASEHFCFRLSLPTVPGETRCYRVQYGSAP